MKTLESTEDRIHSRFVALARELDRHFPNLDLRFNLCRSTARVLSHKNSSPLEFDLEDCEPQELVHQAIFSIKEQARIFDA